jgi:phage terminase small subunit
MFVEEYLVDLNATQAAIRAGYSVKTANEQAGHLLVNVSIRRAIREAMARRAAKIQLKAERVVQELMDIGFLDPADIFDFNGAVPVLKRASRIPERARRAIASVKIKTLKAKRKKGEDDPPEAQTITEVEVKFWSKPDALEKLCRHLGILPTGKSDDKPPFSEAGGDDDGPDFDALKRLDRDELIRRFREAAGKAPASTA